MWLINLFTGGLGTIIQSILGVVGKTVVDLKNTEANRQANENDNGTKVAESYIEGATAAGAQRADVQKSQGAWGPFGLAAFFIAMAFAFHTIMVVLDSTGWHLSPTLHFYVVPWLEWTQHTIGSWHVAALPGKFEETEHEVLKALFYVGPPSAAAVVVAKAFRR